MASSLIASLPGGEVTGNLTESAHKLGENGDKMQGKHVDFEVFFTQEAIRPRDDKIYGVTENVIYCYK